jgi:hypothetical protein
VSCKRGNKPCFIRKTTNHSTTRYKSQYLLETTFLINDKYFLIKCQNSNISYLEKKMLI